MKIKPIIFFRKKKKQQERKIIRCALEHLAYNNPIKSITEIVHISCFYNIT